MNNQILKIKQNIHNLQNTLKKTTKLIHKKKILKKNKCI
jgi:hypothetical protein